MQLHQESDEREAEQTLTGLARGRFGRIDPTRIARHVLAVTPHADWAVRRAALEALARRYAFAQRDGLRVSERPPAHGVVGIYRTRALGARGIRPYATALLAVEPLRTSCACADFVRSSLGLCKHGLIALEALERSGRLKQGGAPAPGRARKAALEWDPVHPLRGPGQRLARLRYVHAGRGQPPPGFSRAEPRSKVIDDPAATLALIVDLERRLARGTLVAEPAITTLLAEERSRAERRSALRDARDPLSRVRSLSRKLYPYQREGVKRFFETGRLLLADDMGLGKTTQAIAACHGLFESKRVRRGLLIVPAALKPQWLREWQATTGVPLALVDGAAEDRARIYASTKVGFLAIGYEQLLRDFERVRTFAPEMVVLDEAQRIKNWATKSAAYVKALDPAYRLVLTGTPMENRFDELASIMDFVDDLALEPKWRLVPFYQLQQGDGGKGVGGARNLDVLRERLAGSMVRRVRKDVLDQLPARTDTRVPVEMTDVQRSHHDELIQPIAELVSKAGRRSLTQAEFLRLMQLLTTQRIVCNGMAQLNFADEWPRCERARPSASLLESMSAPKLTVFRGLIEQVAVAQRRKLVVFSQWRAMLRLSEWAVRDVLSQAGLRAVFFTGAESNKQRERAIVEFHDDPATAVMFLSDAGGVGLNLQRAASACVNLELPWNPAVLEQRIGRIYRLGQKLPIDVFNLVTEDGIEGRIARLLGQKKAVFSALFDGTSDSVLFDGQASFLEGVKKLVDPVEVPGALTGDEGQETTSLAASSADEPESIVALPEAVEVVSETQPRPFEAGLKIARLPDGGLRIDAAPELALPLANLLESLAGALRGASAGVSAGA